MVITKRNVYMTLWILVLVTIIYTLMYVSSQVKELEKHISTTEQRIKSEKDNMRTLRAEWSYLTNPKRIEKLTKKLLPELMAVKAEDIKNLKDIPNSKRLIKIEDDSSITPQIIKIAITE